MVGKAMGRATSKATGNLHEAAVHEARTRWQASLDALKAIYVERDRLRAEGCGDAKIDRLNEQIEAARQEEFVFWEAYAEIATTFIAA